VFQGFRYFYKPYVNITTAVHLLKGITVIQGLMDMIAHHTLDLPEEYQLELFHHLSTLRSSSDNQQPASPPGQLNVVWRGVILLAYSFPGAVWFCTP